MHGTYYNATIAAYVTLYLRLGKAEVSPRKPEDMLVYLLSACVETSLDRVSVWSRFALILVFCDEFGSHSRNGYATLFIFSEVILHAPALL